MPAAYPTQLGSMGQATGGLFGGVTTLLSGAGAGTSIPRNPSLGCSADLAQVGPMGREGLSGFLSLGLITFVSRQACALTLLTAPTRFIMSVGQTHTAGNLLVVLVHSRQDGSTPLTSVTNTAGDTFLRSVSSPYEDFAGGIHYFETWYCLATKGAVGDLITLSFGGVAPAIENIAVYEFSANGQTFVYTGVDGSGGSGFDISHGGVGYITTGTLAITVPSVVVANYRSDSSANPPITPSGTQFSNIVDSLIFDSYQFTQVSGTANASYSTINTDPQWGILASVFALGPPLPVGVGCAQDLPPVAGTA